MEHINDIRIERVWAMPNRKTFTIKPIAKLLKEEMTGGGTYIDPFAGTSSPAVIKNDLNPDLDVEYHMDAVEFLHMFEDNSVDGVLFDPPYSPRQVRECYDGFGGKRWDGRNNFWSDAKAEVARIVKPRGKVLCFGWNSMGIGINRGLR